MHPVNMLHLLTTSILIPFACLCHHPVISTLLVDADQGDMALPPEERWKRSEVEELLQLLHRVSWVRDCMPNGTRVGEDLVIITTLCDHNQASRNHLGTMKRSTNLVRLVTEEMNSLEFLVCDVVQAERLVPAVGKDIE